MKLFYIFFLVVAFTINLKAQYQNIRISNNASTSKIIQIDYREFSTLVHFTYTNKKSFKWIQLKESVYVRDIETNKQYKLLNSINMPIGDKYHVLENTSQSQTHNFSLEFEKLPDSVSKIDIIGGEDSGFNLYGVEIIKTSKVDYLDLESFIKKTPIKENGYFYKNDNTVFTYKYKGVTMYVQLFYNNNYGKYYQINILIRNLSGKDLNFNPAIIVAEMLKGEEKFDVEVLSYNTYMKKVKNRQAWAAAAVAFSESMAASNAGYSNSTSSNVSSGYSTTSGSASGYVGNTYGSIYGSSSTYSSTYSTSYSKNYSGANAYVAQQNANNNIANYQNQQYQIKNSLSQGYARLNTIPNETEYVGYVNIKYKKVDHLNVIIPFFDTKFEFFW